jgi:hypothetical protein
VNGLPGMIEQGSVNKQPLNKTTLTRHVNSLQLHEDAIVAARRDVEVHNVVARSAAKRTMQLRITR